MLDVVITVISELDYSRVVDSSSLLEDILPNKADLIEAILALEDNLGLQLDLTEIARLNTLGDLAGHVEKIARLNTLGDLACHVEKIAQQK